MSCRGAVITIILYMQDILSVEKLNPLFLGGTLVRRAKRSVKFRIKFHVKRKYLERSLMNKILVNLNTKEATELNFIRRTIGISSGSSIYDMSKLISSKLARDIISILTYLPNNYFDHGFLSLYGNFDLILPKEILNMVNYVISSKRPFNPVGSQTLFYTDDVNPFVHYNTNDDNKNNGKFILSELAFINEISKLLKIFGESSVIKVSDLGQTPDCFMDCSFTPKYGTGETKYKLNTISIRLGSHISDDSYAINLLLIPEIKFDDDVTNYINNVEIPSDVFEDNFDNVGINKPLCDDFDTDALTYSLTQEYSTEWGDEENGEEIQLLEKDQE